MNLRDEALELSKKKARELGVSLGEVVSDAILAAYRDRPAEDGSTPFDLPVSGEGGLQEGVDLDNTALLEDLMEDRK